MPPRKKKALGRGMAELVEGSFSSIIEPPAGRPREDRPARPRDPSSPDAAGASAGAPAPVAASSASAISPSPPSPPSHEAPAGPAPRRHPGHEAAAHSAGSRDSVQSSAAAAPIRRPYRPPAAVRDEGARLFDVVSISSGKGGTGKSVLASNLAVLLAPATRVTILDADLGLANIHILFNLMPRYNASHVITGEKSLDEIMIQGPRGVNIIPGGSGIPELASLTDLRFASLVSGIAALDHSTDLLLIDTPSGIDRQSLTFLLASDQVLVVTTEDVTAMTDAYAVIKTLVTRRPDASIILVVNQARSYADGLETFQKVSHVARKFLGRELSLGGVIPSDEMVDESIARRVPVTLLHPACPASRAMASIAARIGTFHARSPRVGAPFTARLKRFLTSPASR